VILPPFSHKNTPAHVLFITLPGNNGKALPFFLPPQRCVAAGCVRNWMRPVISSPSDASLPGCVRNWMRPVNGDASLPGCVRNWMRPVNGDASLPGCVRELDASSYLLSKRCVAARMRPETGCVQFAAMCSCPDASGTECVQLTAISSLLGCVRNLDASN
jgi:hypothetical protein